MRLLVDVALDVTPLPWRRPAQGRAGRFTDPTLRAYEDELAWEFRRARLTSAPAHEPVVAWLVFRTGRGDLDNLAKAVLDAGNEILWTDDRWIRELHLYRLPRGPSPLRVKAAADVPDVPSDLR